MSNNTTTSIFEQYLDSLNQVFIVNDVNGAILFIIVILLWYSSSIVFLLVMQMRKSTEATDEWMNPSTKLFFHSLHDVTTNKEILGELVNKEKRDKLWDIYLGTSGYMHDKIIRADTARIRCIEKQLANLDESYKGEYNNFTDSNLEKWVSETDLVTLNSRLRARRRSSLDYQILEQWKTLSNELKTHDNWPWAIRKLIIRRNLRRYRHATEPASIP